MQSNRTRAVTSLGVTTVVALGTLAGGVGGAGASTGRTHGNPLAISRPRGAGSTDLGVLGAVGTLIAVSATSIEVADPTGATTTYAITPATRVRVGPAPVSTTALATGQLVRVETVPATPTVVSAILLEPAHMEGVVTAVNGGVITLGDPQGFERTVLVNAATTYREASGAVTLDHVRVGSSIVATGVVNGDHTALDAVAIDVGRVPRGGPLRRRGASVPAAGARGFARRSGHPPRIS